MHSVAVHMLHTSEASVHSLGSSKPPLPLARSPQRAELQAAPPRVQGRRYAAPPSPQQTLSLSTCCCVIRGLARLACAACPRRTCSPAAPYSWNHAGQTTKITAAGVIVGKWAGFVTVCGACDGLECQDQTSKAGKVGGSFSEERAGAKPSRATKRTMSRDPS